MRTASFTSKALSMFAVACALLVAARPAGAQIKEPDRHPHYAVELEPHLVLQYGDNWFARGTGVGPGFRASIPILQDGPIPKINNSLGISFGVDWAFFGGCDGAAASVSCNVNQLWFPVVAQWNFFFTPIVSVFGEVGLALVNRHYSYGAGCPYLDTRQCSHDNFDPFEPVFFAGGRFLFSRSIGMVVRLGLPSISIGADFLL